MQVFTVVDLFNCLPTSMINLAIRDDSSAFCNESSVTALFVCWGFRARRLKCNCWTVTPHPGHMTSSSMMSSQVTKTFRSITSHRIEVEPWTRCHCVCLAKTHLLIFNMTYLGHYHVRSFDLTKCQIFKLTFRRQDAYVSMRLYKGNTMVFDVFLFLSQFKSYLQKTGFSPKSSFFLWPALGRSKGDLR